MAQIDHPLFGKLKGKVDGLVYYTVNGITHIRSYPEKIKNPRSPLQEEQRNRLRDAMTLYKTIRHTPLEKIWQCATRQSNLTGANLFIKMHIAAFFGDGKVTDYGKLHFSCGRLPQGDRFQAHYLPGTECVEVRWETNGRINSKRYDDRFMAISRGETAETKRIPPSDQKSDQKVLECMQGNPHVTIGELMNMLYLDGRQGLSEFVLRCPDLSGWDEIPQPLVAELKRA